MTLHKFFKLNMGVGDIFERRGKGSELVELVGLKTLAVLEGTL
jgi:hypothetical protein